MTLRISKRQPSPVEEISRVSLALTKAKVYSVATDVAKIAIDLTNGKGVIKISPNGVSIGDRVRCNTVIKRKNTIPKATPGNVVGYDPETGKYLVLFFPVWFSAGVLVLVTEKDISFLVKPKIEEDTEHVFTSPDKTEDAPKIAIVKAFSDEILSKNGLSVAGSWMISRGEGEDTWTARAVVKRQGTRIPRGNKKVAGEIIRGVVTTLKNEVLPSLKKSGVRSFVDLAHTSAWEASIVHDHLPSYAALEITYRV